MDPERTSYVHVMDGGIADNLALRTLVNALFALDPTSTLFHTIAMHTRRVVVLSVDGQAATDPKIGQQRVVTGLGQILGAVSGTQIDAYNFETLTLAQARIQILVHDIKAVRCAQAHVIDGHACEDVQGDLIHLSLQGVTDASERARLQAIPTGLTIPKADVDALMGYGETLILENKRLHELLDGVGRKDVLF
jgi:NTE family protein